ncbi:MAG: response regulator transcription factor [Gammaproteobacteria bacterium]|jgi:CheY-like chemotaxis protein
MKTILLTDDNPDMIELVQLILSNSGYQLITAKDGNTAIQMCQESIPDLVLLDLKMPDIDGISVIKTLRDNNFTNPIIVLTASESEDDKEQAYAAGCNGFIIKTMEMRELEHAIDVQLHTTNTD